MPEEYQETLRGLCWKRDYLKLIFSAATDVNAGFRPTIDAIEDGMPTRLVQFRIDDDDCLCPTYIQQLRKAADRFSDLDAFSYSIPKGLVATAYTDRPPKYNELYQPFHSGGCAVRPHRRGFTVFSYGHFSLMTRFPALIDNSGLGHLALKLDDQDSEKLFLSERAR